MPRRKSMDIRTTVLFVILIMIINTNATEETDSDYGEANEIEIYDYEEKPEAEPSNYEYETPAEEEKQANDKESPAQKDSQGDHDKAATRQQRNDYVPSSRETKESPRILFHEQGLKGPHSYRYGYDTGGSKNRMTKYEERDNKGNVKGSYSFRDANGKVQVVNYEAHPIHGFRASGTFGTFP